jgi:hypothetical protein
LISSTRNTEKKLKIIRGLTSLIFSYELELPSFLRRDFFLSELLLLAELAELKRLIGLTGNIRCCRLMVLNFELTGLNALVQAMDFSPRL